MRVLSRQNKNSCNIILPIDNTIGDTLKNYRRAAEDAERNANNSSSEGEKQRLQQEADEHRKSYDALFNAFSRASLER